LIKKTKWVPDPTTYVKHFGSLWRAYELIGYKAKTGTHQDRWSRTNQLSDEELLEALRGLLRAHGYLSERLIDKHGATPTSPTYIRRFGSLARSYALLEYVPPKQGNQYTGRRGQEAYPTASASGTGFRPNASRCPAGSA
jgi:hypothetical protein